MKVKNMDNTATSNYEHVDPYMPTTPRKTLPTAPQRKWRGTAGCGDKGRSLDISRSLSSPTSTATVEYLEEPVLSNFQTNQRKNNPVFMSRSYSSPEPSAKCLGVDRRDDAASSRRNSEPVYEMSSLDSESEQNEGFHHPLLSMNAEMEQTLFRSNPLSPMLEPTGVPTGPQRVVAAMLPGTGLHRVEVKRHEPGPHSKVNKMTSDRGRSGNSARIKQGHFSKALVPSRQQHPGLRPLRLMMPHSENTSDFDRELGMDFSREMTLDSADMNCLDLDQEMRLAERHIREARPVSAIMAIEETDEEGNDQSDVGNKVSWYLLLRAHSISVICLKS